MHSYMLSDGRWWVFHYRLVTIRGVGAPFAEQKLIMMADFAREHDAAAYVNYLNGGEGRSFALPATKGDA